MRKVELGEQPKRFFEAYELALRAIGYSEGEIQALAAALMDMYLGLQLVVRIRGNPEFHGPDRRRPGFSFYIFADGVVGGLYSASPDVVYLEYVTFTFAKEAEAEEIIGRRNAAVHAAA